MGYGTQLVNIHCSGATYDRLIDRTTPFGNPYTHRPTGTTARFIVATRQEAIAAFKTYCARRPGLVAYMREELRGLVLGCHCLPQACHGEIVVAICECDDDSWLRPSATPQLSLL